MNMRSNRFFLGRVLCAVLAICLVAGGLISCSGQGSEIPDGYQYATCNGEYFRLFLPTQWTVNTESGVSGGYTSAFGDMAVSMTEVPFELSEASEATSAVATLADFYEAHMSEVSKLRDYKLEKTADTTMSASDGGKRAAAKDITYTASVAGVVYRYRQVLCKVEGRFYVFTCSYNAKYFNELSEAQQLEISAIVEEIRGNIVFHSRPFEDGVASKKIPDVETPDGMKLVSDNDVAYRFFAPDSWVVAKGSAACQVYFSETDRSNVSVIGYVPSMEGYSVEDYWAETLLNYQSALADFQLISTTTEGETMGDRKATVYEFTYSLGGVQYHARQVVCVYSYMIVSMTYTALPEHYDEHLADAEAMQAALTFRRAVLG